MITLLEICGAFKVQRHHQQLMSHQEGEQYKKGSAARNMAGTLQPWYHSQLNLAAKISEFNLHDDTTAANSAMDSNEGLVTVLSESTDYGTKSATCLCGAFKVQFSLNIVTAACLPLIQYSFPMGAMSAQYRRATSYEARCLQAACTEIF